MKLKNGLRIAYKQVLNRKVAHCGFVINTGTRDEKTNENGLAHFLEHMLFKGTNKRKAYHILNRLEVIGGDLNAYTTKEKTCIYASFIDEYFDRAFDLLSDVVFESNFPAKELEKEKQVVLDEINAYKDNFEESLYDDFERLMFPNHPLGAYTLGLEETVSKYDQNQIKNFYKRQYNPSNIIFSYVGNLDFRIFSRRIEKKLGEIPMVEKPNKRLIIKNYKPFDKTILKSSFQLYGILGNRAYSIHHPKKYILVLLNNILGGDNLNSRLNLQVREKNGLVYHIGSDYSAYSDTGVFSISFSTDPKNLKRILKLVQKEMKLLREKPLTNRQLQLAKRQLINRILMSEDSTLVQMLGQAKNLLDFGKVTDLQEVIEIINRISSEDLMEVAQEIFHPEKLSSLIYLPKN